MKKIGSLLICFILSVSAIIPLVYADAALTNVRFDATGSYNMISNGVGLSGVTTGSIQIDVKGDVVAAYLYWSGIGTETTGDNSVEFDANTVTALDTYGPDTWFLHGRHYVYVAEVTSLIISGDKTYTISDFSMPVKNYGAGLVVVYEDEALPVVRVILLDGLDAFWFGWESPIGPDSEVFGFDFDPASSDREANILLLAGGTEHDDRPNEIYTQTGTGADPKPGNLVTGGDLDGDYPLEASDGNAWDTYTQGLTIPSGDEWLCAQVESIYNYEIPKEQDPLNGRGTSALLIATGLMLPIERGLDGLSPGFWKHNVKVALDLNKGSFSVPHEGEDRMNYVRIVALAEVATGLTGKDALMAALVDLEAKGHGSDIIRLAMCNAFNAAAGYEQYSD